MGQDPLHALEGCSISLLIGLLNEHCPDDMQEWTLKSVFDGLQADIMPRHSSFEQDMYICIQIKSAQPRLGKVTT